MRSFSVKCQKRLHGLKFAFDLLDWTRRVFRILALVWEGFDQQSFSKSKIVVTLWFWNHNCSIWENTCDFCWWLKSLFHQNSCGANRLSTLSWEQKVDYFSYKWSYRGPTQIMNGVCLIRPSVCPTFQDTTGWKQGTNTYSSHQVVSKCKQEFFFLVVIFSFLSNSHGGQKFPAADWSLFGSETK